MATLTQMSMNSQSNPVPDRLISYFESSGILRSRSVSNDVLVGRVNVPAPSARLLADWEREMTMHLNLEPGDVEALPLARARTRWPDYRLCVDAMSDWLGTLGVPDVLASSNVALMACRGVRYHHDGAQYGAAAFCNLFLSENKELEVHFPMTGHRIPLVLGTVLMFDTCQPHAVVPRGRNDFNAADFVDGKDCSQVFLTWELPIEHIAVARALRITFDTDARTALQLEEAQVWVNGATASVCPESGAWGVALG